MKGIEGKIKEHTRSISEKTLDRAKRVKERELALARKKKEDIILEGRNKEDKIINTQMNSLRAQLILEYRLKEDNFKDKLCSELLDEAKHQMDNLDDNTILDSLKNIIREGVLNLGLNKALIRINKKSTALLKEHYSQVLNFIKEKVDNFEAIDIDDSLNSYGVIINSQVSGELFDNTFKRRFKRFEDEFKEKILERLG